MEKRIKRNQSIFITSLIGAGIAIVLTFLLLLTLPTFIIKSDSANSITKTVAPIIILISSLGGTFFAAMRQTDAPYQAAFITSGLYWAFIIIGALFISGEFDFINALIESGLIIASAAIAGYSVRRLATDKKRKMKKITKRR